MCRTRIPSPGPAGPFSPAPPYLQRPRPWRCGRRDGAAERRSGRGPAAAERGECGQKRGGLRGQVGIALTVAIVSRQRPAGHEGGAGVGDGAPAAAVAAMSGREKGKNPNKSIRGLSWRGFVHPGALPLPPFPAPGAPPASPGVSRAGGFSCGRGIIAGKEGEWAFQPMPAIPACGSARDVALCRVHCPAALCAAAAGTRGWCPGTAVPRDGASSVQQVLRVLTELDYPNYLGELPAQLQKEVSGGCRSEACREGSITRLDSE